ncbi:MAG: nucleotidyltransferase family protein [Bacteroidales bacterium]|nr:nucleotidyltransferase family protein [Bacteroidales bacterium]
MREKFLELLKIAIGIKNCFDCVPSPDEWKVLYEISKSQSLVGICFLGIQKLPIEQHPPLEIELKFLGWSGKIQNKNLDINKRCVLLQQKLHQAGFKVCFLKGQGNATFYPEPLLRQSGDIDIWVDGGFDKVLKYVNSVKHPREATDQDIDFPVFRDTEVELHYKAASLPNPFKSKRVGKWFDDIQQKSLFSKTLLPDGNDIIIPNPEMNLVYQLIHIYRHFFELGIGMRQIMDYYYLLINCIDVQSVDIIEVKTKIKEFGLTKFAKSLMYVLQSVFCLDNKYLLFTPDIRNGKFLLNEIFLTGNFGYSDHRLQLKDTDSHFKRFIKRTIHQYRHFFHYPCDTFWNGIYIITIYFRYRQLRKIIKNNRTY